MAAMIRFNCGGCGRAFNVPESFAGRRATCKTCGTSVVVPAAGEPFPTGPALVAQSSVIQSAAVRPVVAPAAVAPSSVAPPAASGMSLRIRRLHADAAQIETIFRDFPLIRPTAAGGSPPDVYEIDYYVRGLERGEGDEPVVREHHRARITLTSEYPRFAPQCRMLTPIFHPNIDASSICVGDHWTAGERLAALVIRIGEMIAYQAYNIRSPLDAQAAMWADLHPDRLPIDPRNLHPAE